MHVDAMVFCPDANLFACNCLYVHSVWRHLDHILLSATDFSVSAICLALEMGTSTQTIRLVGYSEIGIKCNHANRVKAALEDDHKYCGCHVCI